MKSKVSIRRVESSTTKGKYYVIRDMPNGETLCSCPGFVFNGKCKHVTPKKK